MDPNVSRPVVALVAQEVHDEGGAERAVAEIVRRLGHRFRFVVVASDVQPDVRELVTWRRVRAPRRPVALARVVFAVGAALRLRRVKADIRHVVDASTPVRADIVTLHFSHTQFVATMRRPAPPGLSPLRTVTRSLTRMVGLAAERVALRPGRTGAIAAVSRRQGDDLRRLFPSVAVELTPNGCDFPAAPPPGTREALRREAGAGEDDVVALFVGSDFERKGLDIALEAIALARRRSPRRIRLWVVGGGDVHRYQGKARRLGLEHDVTFFGPRSDPPRFYAAADVFVLPTRYETFCLAAYEAAASRLPIVATPVNGVDELVADGGAGIAVEVDAESVASALAELAADGERRARMGEEGRARSAAYTWERSTDAVAALYDEVLARSA
ncbi:MAG TPA: glycosyltransferase family 4 protein [Solirubrobacteraceae bacterium]|nr:glycosyltransferase family 4 protein [Solirubrobacteraceae bacterium]